MQVRRRCGRDLPGGDREGVSTRSVGRGEMETLTWPWAQIEGARVSGLPGRDKGDTHPWPRLELALR